MGIFLSIGVSPAQPDSGSGALWRGAPQRASSGWHLVWADEFSGSTINPQRWSHVVDCWGGGNDEKQCYTDRPANSFVRGGLLHIVARRESFTGSAEPADTDKATAQMRTLPYTSARLRSKGKGDWTYGRIEARIKLPSGQGVWPAFWMMPTDEAHGEWPSSGEIDILEAVNLGTKCSPCAGGRENRISGAIHFGRSLSPQQMSGRVELPRGSENTFHVYAIEWSKTSIDWFVDGRKFFSANAQEWDARNQLYAAPKGAPFDRRFHLILNLAIGGDWPENANERGINERGFPKVLLVDWVRVYSRREGRPKLD